MKASDLVAPVIEPVTGRYDRDLLNLNDDRKVRGFDYKDEERRSRDYVDPAAVDVTVTVVEAAEFTGQVETDRDVTGTVTDVFDNTPAGFDRDAFEAKLAHNASVAETATAGSPGSFGPTGAHTPSDLAELDGVTAEPQTAWTTGQHVVLGDASQAHWNGSAWAAGAAV